MEIKAPHEDYCSHQYKIIRAEEGKEKAFSLLGALGLSWKDVIIYHQQCAKCGKIIIRYGEVCDRDKPYKVLQEVKWQH